MKKATVNGIKLAYERRGRGTPFVLLHGYPLDHSIWQPLVERMKKHSELILPDLRGFGESGAVAGEYSLADMANDVAGLLDVLNLDKVFLAGHSMGGYIALAFARAYPGRLLGLGLVASQAAADSPEARQRRYDTIEQVRMQGVGVVADSMPARLTADPQLQAALRNIVLRQRVEGIVAALQALAARPDSTPVLPSLDFPVVIVHGLADALIPIERAREVLASVPHGRLVEVEKAGHMPMMEASDLTAEALTSWL